MEKENSNRGNNIPATFRVGAISLAFLIIGYQVALFVHRVSVERIESARDRPDTVYVVDSALAARILGSGIRTPSPSGGHTVEVRRDAPHTPAVTRVRDNTGRIESFRFNPNSVTVDELIRLGFTRRQAESIDNYRAKGGRYCRKSDFAASFAVPDSVFARLEPFIDIPRVDINIADSAAFDALPGIGGYFAAKMVSYREELGGYSFPEQLMDIWHFDRERYDGLSDLICCSAPRDSFGLWTLPADELKKHPYIHDWRTARAIVLYRDNNPRSDWTPMGLAEAGIISNDTARKLSCCAIARPPDISRSAP